MWRHVREEDALLRSFSTSARGGGGWSSRLVTARKPWFYVYPRVTTATCLDERFNQPRFWCYFVFLKRAVKWTNSKEIIVVPLLNFQEMQTFWLMKLHTCVCTKFTECAHNREFRFIRQSPLSHGYYQRLLLNMDRRVHWAPRAKFVLFFFPLSVTSFYCHCTYELYQKCCSGQQWVLDDKK